MSESNLAWFAFQQARPDRHQFVMDAGHSRCELSAGDLSGAASGPQRFGFAEKGLHFGTFHEGREDRVVLVVLVVHSAFVPAEIGASQPQSSENLKSDLRLHSTHKWKASGRNPRGTPAEAGKTSRRAFSPNIMAWH